MSTEALWDKAIDVCKPQKWGKSMLYKKDDAGVERFCALGMIGYARWGQQWVEDLRALHDGRQWSADEEDQYEALKQDPQTQEMIRDLVKVIKEQRPELWEEDEYGHRAMYPSTEPQNVVYCFNDDFATSKDLRAYFEKARANAEEKV